MKKKKESFPFPPGKTQLDVTRVLCELELIIKRVKVSTTSNGTVMDVCFITDARQKLRQIEVALIEYRESLEERGIKKEEVEKKVTAHQKQLQYKYGLTNYSEDAPNKRTSFAERREKGDDSRESSRKCQRSHHGSESPHRQSSSRDREKGRTYDAHIEREKERDHDRDKHRERERDSRRR